MNSVFLINVISNPRKLHLFVPVSNSIVEVRFYSASDFSRKECVMLAKDNLPPERIVGFVTCFMMEIGG